MAERVSPGPGPRHSPGQAACLRDGVRSSGIRWMAQTLGDVLARNAELFPDEEALVIGERRLTYGELHAHVEEMAAGLGALGVKRGDHVAVCMGNTPEWVVFFYAAATLGAVTVPVNTRFKADELAYCLKQADVKLLFVVDRFLRIDFVSMLREICPAVDKALPDPALPKLANIVVLGENVPAGALALKETLALGAAWD